ncbi:MAG: RNA polymerase sigma factor (sigma-70 family) [Flavobacteriales bacterium]|jgi:RNA polymerase sigma factor (sigma-70 family)
MRIQELDDSKLVCSYIDGNDKALNVLVQRHQQRVFSFVMMKVKNSDVANDIFQDTFIKVIKTLREGKYNEEGKFLPWLMRIAHNLTIDFFRKNKRMAFVNSTEDFNVVDIIPEESKNIEGEMVQNQIENDLRKLIDELPEEQREVLIMRHYADMSFKDIAEQTHVSINTALGRMRYALINIRKLIEEHDISLTIN